MSNPTKKLKYCRPDWITEYFNPDWNAEVKISQQSSINNDIADSPSNLPTLYIKFRFHTLFTGRVDQELPYSRSLHIKLFHSATYMSRDKFFCLMEDNLYHKLWGKLFNKNDLRDFIDDMIEEVHGIIGDECNKGRQHLDVSICMILFVWKMGNDENVMNDDCVICFEEFGKGKERKKEVICMPCSHIFHGDCITTWLQNGHSCPVCRYDLRV